MIKPFTHEDIHTIIEEAKDIITVKTDSKALNDRLLGGISTSEFILIQSASGRGKTTLLERLALRAAVTKEVDVNVAYVSLGEQSDKVIYEQILCMYSGVKYKEEYRKLPSKERNDLLQKMNDEATYKDRLFIYYTREPFENYWYDESHDVRYKRESDIPEECRIDFKQTNDFSIIMKDILKRNIKFIFVDYVGAESVDPSDSNRYEGLKTLCDNLTYFADKYNVCIVGAIQMNKNYLLYEQDKEHFNPACVNELFTSDSINTVRKCTIGISFIRDDEKKCCYFNVFKGRYVNLGVVKVKINQRTYRWYDGDEDVGFE